MKKTEKISVSPFYAKLILTIGLLICVPMLIVQILLFFSSYKALNEQNSRYYYLRSQNPFLPVLLPTHRLPEDHRENVRQRL